MVKKDRENVDLYRFPDSMANSGKLIQQFPENYTFPILGINSRQTVFSDLPSSGRMVGEKKNNPRKFILYMESIFISQDVFKISLMIFNKMQRICEFYY